MKLVVPRKVVQNPTPTDQIWYFFDRKMSFHKKSEFSAVKNYIMIIYPKNKVLTIITTIRKNSHNFVGHDFQASECDQRKRKG